MIGAFSERVGGLLRAADLAGYRARLEPPLRMAFAGREILGQSARALGHTDTEIGACGVGAVVTRRDPETGVL